MMNMMMCKCSDALADVGPLVLRLALGAVFFYHGYDKLFVIGLPGVTGFMASLGLPFPMLMAYLVTGGELIVGTFLILGLFTHWVSKVGMFIAIVAFFTVHLTKGFAISGGGYEYIMLIFASAFSLMASGAGKYSLDSHLGMKDKTM
jgi:putative oxidoreductase